MKLMLVAKNENNVRLALFSVTDASLTYAAYAQVNMTSCGGRPCVRLDSKSPRWGDKGQYVLVDTRATPK